MAVRAERPAETEVRAERPAEMEVRAARPAEMEGLLEQFLEPKLEADQ